jgi:hypothetical protein
MQALGDSERARKFFERTIKHDQSGLFGKLARRALDKLGEADARLARP